MIRQQNIQEQYVYGLKTFFFQDAVPHQPETATDETDDFEFTKLECLLFAFHTVASQAPTFLTENPDLLKDFKVSFRHYNREHLLFTKQAIQVLKRKFFGQKPA